MPMTGGKSGRMLGRMGKKGKIGSQMTVQDADPKYQEAIEKSGAYQKPTLTEEETKEREESADESGNEPNTDVPKD